MKLPLRRVILVGAIVAVISILFTTSWKNIPGTPSAGMVLARAQAPAAARPQTSEQAFKNIQVLKGIPVDEFMGTMGLFSAALRVCWAPATCGRNIESAVGSRSATKTDGTQDGHDGQCDQPRQLRRAPGRNVLDVSSRQPGSINYASD